MDYLEHSGFWMIWFAELSTNLSWQALRGRSDKFLQQMSECSGDPGLQKVYFKTVVTSWSVLLQWLKSTNHMWHIQEVTCFDWSVPANLLHTHRFPCQGRQTKSRMHSVKEYSIIGEQQPFTRRREDLQCILECECGWIEDNCWEHNIHSIHSRNSALMNHLGEVRLETTYIDHSSFVFQHIVAATWEKTKSTHNKTIRDRPDQGVQESVTQHPVAITPRSDPGCGTWMTRDQSNITCLEPYFRLKP